MVIKQPINKILKTSKISSLRETFVCAVSSEIRESVSKTSAVSSAISS